jgi:phosphoglycerate dehydrogenase-like enzyme
MPLNSVGERSSLKPSRCLNKEEQMKIAFHGANAATFRPGIETYLPGSHDISLLSDELSEAGEEQVFMDAEVIIGTKLSQAHPTPKSARLYQVAGAGYDGIDFTRIPADCYLCNCFGHEEAITEYVMAAVLSKYIPLAEADSKLRQGNWHYMAGKAQGLRQECSGSSIGLLGYGHIGKALARRAKAFNMQVHVANRSYVTADDPVDYYYPLAKLETFFGAVDVLVAALPLTEATTGLVDKKAFAAMRPDSLVINVGRGQVIEEQALYEALQTQQIGGAVIDTWYVYPKDEDDTPCPGNLPFHKLNNVVITPHMSGWTWGTIRRRQQVMSENIHRLDEGNVLLNIVLGDNR